jgi:DNA repair exonuclease SbcCD ATPase subunit
MQSLRVDRIELEGFGCFNERLGVDLPEGNACLFIGPNEAGKSTLAEAIVSVIFGFRTREIERLYEPWIEGSAYAGSIDLRLDKSCRRISRDFSTHDVRVTRDQEVLFSGQANPRGRGTPEQKAYEQILEELFGFSQSEIFTKTVFVRQLELETELSEQVRQVLSGAGPRDHVSALGFLYEEHDRLTVENPWGGRKRKDRLIEEAEEDLRRLDSLLQETASAETDDLELQSRLGDLRRELDGAHRQEKDLLAGIDACGAMLDLQRQLKRGEGEFLALEDEKGKVEQRLKEQRDIRAHVSEKHPDLVELSTAERNELAQAASLIDERRHIAAELETLAGGGGAKWALSRWLPAAMAAAAGIVSGGLAAAAWHSAFAWVVAGALGAALAITLWLLGTARARRDGTKARDRAMGLLERRGVIETRLYQYSDKVAGLGAKEGILHRLASASEMLGRLGVLDAELARSRSIDEIDKDRSRKVLEVSSIRESIERLERERPYLKEESEDLTVTVERLKTDLGARREKTDRVEGEERGVEIKLGVIAGAGPRRSPLSVQEEIEEAKSKLEHLRFRKEAIEIAVGELRNAVADYSKDCLVDVSRRAGGLLSKVTGGRYTQVSLEGEDMNPVVGFAGGRPVEPDCISRGTRDQLFLSLRVALLEGLSGRRRLPLVLDDCLVNFDDSRMERAKEVLLSVAEEGHQLILLSHDRRLESWGIPVLKLGANS